MKVKELITTARSLMMDNMSSTHLDVYAMTHVNVLIAELFEENNGLRSKRNKTRLYQIPIVKTEDDELIYEEEMLYNIMPKGLAARFLQDEDDRSRYTMMQTEYMNARSAHIVLVCDEGWNV